jgi:hypothetical protein
MSLQIEVPKYLRDDPNNVDWLTDFAWRKLVERVENKRRERRAICLGYCLGECFVQKKPAMSYEQLCVDCKRTLIEEAGLFSAAAIGYYLEKEPNYYINRVVHKAIEKLGLDFVVSLTFEAKFDFGRHFVIDEEACVNRERTACGILLKELKRWCPIIFVKKTYVF